MAQESAFTMRGYRLTQVSLDSYRSTNENDLFELQIGVNVAPPNEKTGKWTCTVECRSWFPENLSEDIPFQLNVSAVGEFEALELETLNKPQWQKVIKSQCPALVYTQLRPVLRVIMAEAGYPQFILPLINFSKMNEPSEPVSNDAGDA